MTLHIDVYKRQLYGNMDMVERLNWMDEHYLSHFEKIDVEANISLQEPFAAPREAVKPVSYTHLDVYKRQKH